jgi:hypothetical protein
MLQSNSQEERFESQLNHSFWSWAAHGGALWVQWIRNKHECDKKDPEFQIDHDFVSNTTLNTKLLEVRRIIIENLINILSGFLILTLGLQRMYFSKITWKQLHY